MKEIGIGIVGYGFMGKTHSYGYKTIPLYYDNLPFRIRLVGICDVNLDVANQAKEALGFEYATSDPEVLYNDPDITVINVCTPNIFHKDAVLKAIQHGKHVYCDKPLATSYEETKEITQVLDQYDVTTQMALQYRFFPATMRAKELIEEDRIGNIMSFRCFYLHSGSVDPNKKIGWKQDKKLGGGGVLFDLGSHALDLMYSLLGEYSSVFAKTKVLYSQRPDKNGNLVDIDADDIAFMILNMKNGGIGTIEVSKIATGMNDEVRFEIHGDKGSMRFNLMDPNWLDFYDNTVPDAELGGCKGYTRIECVQRFKKPGAGFPGPKFSIGWIRAHVHCLYSFLDNVYNGTKASPSFEEGAYIQYVMQKAYESDLTQKWIDL
ncbi:MAG: Gfo/Idh/MocA family protein [Saccharofermentanales bacterium]